MLTRWHFSSTMILLFLVTVPACNPGLNPADNSNGTTSGTGNENQNDNSSDNDDDGTPTGRTVFAVIGDYGDDDDNSRDVSELIKSWNPDFIITTGDNDYSDGAFRGSFEGLELGVGQFFHEFIGDYQGSIGSGSSSNRFFPTPGDHDWGDTCDDPAGLDDYLRYFTLPAENSGNERYYDYRQGPIHFFSLHSIQDCEPDGASAESVQAQWVRETARASDATFKIAYFHNPPYSSGDRHIGGGNHMRWPWGEMGFDLVLSGDDHIYERIIRDDVTYLVVGLGGVDIHGLVDTPVQGSVIRYAEDYGALRVTVEANSLTAEFITVGGVVVDAFSITSNETAPDGMESQLDPDVLPITEGSWYRPNVPTTWQWQLQPNSDGEINQSYDVDVYDMDLFDSSQSLIDSLHDEGRKVICYFSAGTFESFRDDADRFAPDDLGSPLEDFADERWLDIRSNTVRAVMLERLDIAAEKNCDGVEPDNVDGFANDSGFDLTATDQLAFNRFLANEAHQRGLAVGLKNDLDQISDLVEYFDFAVNEQCHEFDECDALQAFLLADKPVFSAEYADALVNSADQRGVTCENSRSLMIQTLILPTDLDDSFRFTCEP